MNKEDFIDGRFVEFITFPWGPDIDEILDLENICVKLFSITDDQVEWIKGYNFEKNKNLNISCGYIATIKSKLLDCVKYTNIEKPFFENVYKEISDMDFENIMVNCITGDDGGQFEIKIGQNNGLNEYYKKIGLWSPPSTEDNKSIIQIKKLLKIYEEIKYKIDYNSWYKEILLNEYKSFKSKKVKKC